jgi:transposase
MTQYVGIDWAYRRAAWCARGEGGQVIQEGLVPADEDGLARLVLELGSEIEACVEMMSGAVFVRDRLQAAGWKVQIADPRKVSAVSPLACKTDKVDARVLSELVARDLVPELWIPSLDERALKERLRRRSHLVRMRTSAQNRIFGLQTQWGLRLALHDIPPAHALERLAEHGMPEVWRRSVAEALEVIALLDERLKPIEEELRPLARADPRVQLLRTIPGIGELLGLTIASEVSDVARFANAGKLVGYAGLSPRIKQSRAELTHRAALQGRLAYLALGRCGGCPARLETVEPLASALSRPLKARRQEPREVRRRAQDLDRLLARTLAPRALQGAAPAARSSCPGKLDKRSGRLTALH